MILKKVFLPQHSLSERSLSGTVGVRKSKKTFSSYGKSPRHNFKPSKQALLTYLLKGS